MTGSKRAGSPALLTFTAPLRTMLIDRGYATSTVLGYVRALEELSGWPQVRRLQAGALSEAALRRAVRSRCQRGQSSPAIGKRVLALVGHLRELEALTAAEPTPAQRLLEEYVGYALREQRLAPLTARTRADVIRRFLAWHADHCEGRDLPDLGVGDVHRFVLHEAARLHRGSVGPVMDSMRSFLRFAFATGLLPRDLAPTLPAVATRQHPPLRHAVDKDTLAALFASCDRSTPTGLRDFAVLTVLVRLGLRANEAAVMSLDDIDWRAGALLVHGKGRRDEPMPLPADVGAALAAYLQHGRPAGPSRTVFLRHRTPAGDLGRNGVVMVPRRAARRAGLPVVGTHRLRHTTAANLLAAGASWDEVSQVLRHTRAQTTAIYVSAEPDRLADVVHAWPGAAR
jgi:site-specific recombinase XerD